MLLVTCAHCGPKFAGFFTDAEKKRLYDGSRLCIQCQGKQSKITARRRSRGLAGMVRVARRA